MWTSKKACVTWRHCLFFEIKRTSWQLECRFVWRLTSEAYVGALPFHYANTISIRSVQKMQEHFHIAFRSDCRSALLVFPALQRHTYFEDLTMESSTRTILAAQLERLVKAPKEDRASDLYPHCSRNFYLQLVGTPLHEIQEQALWSNQRG